MILHRLCPYFIVKLFCEGRSTFFPQSVREVLEKSTLTRGIRLARACRRYAHTGCRFSKDEPGGCTTFTTSTSPRRVRSIERRRESSRHDATRRNATQSDAFSRGRRESLCNTFTMQLHQRRVRPSLCESEYMSNERAESACRNERTHTHTRTHTQTRRPPIDTPVRVSNNTSNHN